MQEIINQLQNTYDLLATIPVSGDSVEVMTAVRINLRGIFKQLNELKTSKMEDNYNG